MKEIPWTFKAWIANFEGVDLPIGDFAPDIAKDPLFPSSENPETIKRYLTSKSHDASMAEAIVDFYLKTK